MNILVAGAFGRLGSDVVRAAVRLGHSVVAAGRTVREIDGLAGTEYKAVQVDVTDSHALEGLCDGIDIVIDAVGLTHASRTETPDDIDFNGNKNVLQEARRAGVATFVYISVIHAEANRKVPLVDAKFRFEEELKASHIDYVIVRPSGYFYDIAHVFAPMIEKGSVSLLGNRPVRANVIDTADLADFIMEHLHDSRATLTVGGPETYTYEEMARLFFDAAGKPAVIKRAPALMFSLLAFINHLNRSGKESVIRFSKWTLSHDMVSETTYGTRSFKAFVAAQYAKPEEPDHE